MRIFETKKLADKKTEIKITYDMKESFKKAIPSAKWNGDNKTWVVGVRSAKKLQDWVLKAKEEFNVEEIENRAEEKQKRLKKSISLKGHTFSFKDELIEKYNAFFHKKEENGTVRLRLYVSEEIHEETQAYLDKLNEQRKRDERYIKKVKLTHQMSVYDNLEVMKKAVKNFKNDEYCSDDEFSEILAKTYHTHEQIKNDLVATIKEIEDHLFFSTENDNTFFVVEETISTFPIWREFFGLGIMNVFAFESCGNGYSHGTLITADIVLTHSLNKNDKEKIRATMIQIGDSCDVICSKADKLVEYYNKLNEVNSFRVLAINN